jgi:hypothetical protein
LNREREELKRLKEKVEELDKIVIKKKERVGIEKKKRREMEE